MKFWNVVWVFFMNPVVSIYYFISSAFFCLTVVGFPYAKILFRFGIYVLAPYGRDFGMRQVEITGPYAKLIALPWFLFFRWVIPVIHIVFSLMGFMTLLAIPNSFVHLMLVEEVYYLFENPWKKKQV